MTNLNLYGIPVRTWIRMNNISVVLGSGEAEQFLGTSQFSSQERNTEGDMGKMLNNVHDEFHTHLVLIIVILSAVVSAVIFVAIIFTLYSCCCSRSSATSNKRCHVRAICHARTSCFSNFIVFPEWARRSHWGKILSSAVSTAPPVSVSAWSNQKRPIRNRLRRIPAKDEIFEIWHSFDRLFDVKDILHPFIIQSTIQTKNLSWAAWPIRIIFRVLNKLFKCCQTREKERNLLSGLF